MSFLSALPESVMAKQTLASMSVAELLKMRDQIGLLLSDRAGALREELASIGGDRGQGTTRRRGRKVKAKYRDPKTGNTWSGRGAAAGWLAAYEKEGRKRDEFLIEKPVEAMRKGPKKKRAKRSRRKK
jgi:DNA-binding protein H-NS